MRQFGLPVGALFEIYPVDMASNALAQMMMPTHLIGVKESSIGMTLYITTPKIDTTSAVKSEWWTTEGKWIPLQSQVQPWSRK
jgi:hypothetical protein